MPPPPESSSQKRLLPSPALPLRLDSLAALLDLYQSLRQTLKRTPEGMYEILEYDSVLEILDPEGETAIFKKRQEIKFLQDHIIAFQDYAWGDGEVLADYQCSPGVVVDRYQEGDRWNILISLRETKNRGDIEEFNITRTDKDCFTKDNEWHQAEIRHPTQHLSLSIIFPARRRCRRAVLTQRSRHRSVVLDNKHFSELPDGRQVLRWETKGIKHFEIYTIKWRW